MEYRLLIVKNKYKKKLNFKTGLDWFADNTPLKMVVDEIETDFDLQFKEVGNGTFKGVVVKNYMDFKKFVPEGKYHAVCLVYGNDCPYVRVSIAENIPLYPDTDFITLVKENDGGKTLNHEIIHALFKRLARKGIKLNDPMDSYKNDSSLTSKDSNRTDALKLLEPYWNQLFMKEKPTVTIDRTKYTSKQVTGYLVAKNAGASFTCKTLELPDLNNAPNISCIPKGVYEVSYTLSPRLMKYTYEIKGVPNRSGIRFHSANYFSDLKGCIALGNGLVDINKDGELDTINSRATIKAFEGFMGNKPFTLIIK